MTETVTLDPIKAKHRAMWSLGNYDKVATEVVAGLGPTIVSAAGVAPGDRVLDVAAGSGNASLPAARAGGTVTATDLTPELLQVGRERAEQQQLQLTWEQADAEHLGFGDDSFDVVLSCVGVMFAPFHQPVADELVRVTRPGGRIALINWTPAGFIGQLFAALKPFAAPPPPGASAGPLWGDADYVRGLFADRVSTLSATTHALPVANFATGAQLRDFFASHYGPTIAAYRNVADDPERTAALDAAIVEVSEQFGVTSGAMEWEYLLVTATA